MNTGRVGIGGGGLERGPDQRSDGDVALAVAQASGTLGQGVAAVDDPVDEPAAGPDVGALQRLARGSGMSRALDTTCVVPMISSGRPPGRAPSA